MRPLNRRGFTLIELLIGILVLALFASTMVAMVRGIAATAARATQSLLADRAVLSLRVFAEQELRDASSSDLTLLSPARLALSRPIGEATVCDDSGGFVLLPDSTWSGTRAPEAARDDVWLLVDVVAGTWLRLPAGAVDRGHCPADGTPATRIAVASHAGSAAFARVVEPVELSAYLSGAADWLGLTPASHSSAVQPFAGPLVPAGTRFLLVPDSLAIALPPRGAPVTAIAVPLGSAP